MALSPMMQQYFDIKKNYADAIVMYRLGDFYEMFFEDAKTASRELELTLTGRDCGEKERAPMCGVPYHSADGYIGKLVSRGYTVVICEQVEDPATAKGIVRREVTRVVTPGTVTDVSQLDGNKNNYISSLYFDGDYSAVSHADISTGEVYATFFYGDRDLVKAVNDLAAYCPSEIITNVDADEYTHLYDFVTTRSKASLKMVHEAAFDGNIGRQRIEGVEGFNDTMNGEVFSPVYNSLGCLFTYIDNSLITVSFKVKSFSYYDDSQYLKMDINTRRNLELTENMRERNKKGSLLSVLDKTKSAPGARLLRRSIEMPLVNQKKIIYRQDAVFDLYRDFVLRDGLGDLLSGVHDIERIMPKLTYGNGNAKDLRAIYNTLVLIPHINALLEDCQSEAIRNIRKYSQEQKELCRLLGSAIVENPPFSVREGGFIEKGYDEELDRLRSIKDNAKDYLARIEYNEREKTGIKSLKIGYNKVFGYYIEISKSYRDKVPMNYIRKQTLVNGERYITEELKELEETIINAAEKINDIEYKLFCSLVEKVIEKEESLGKTVMALAELDMYLSLATVAAENGYVRPEITYDSVVDIKDGRHPVVERFVSGGYFVPNDTLLDTSMNRLMLITGPNMAGKSTYMRQTAIIVLMAQIGSFVPAAEARIGVVDKLFTRVGASDDLAAGQSTFMLEMTEVAYILANATKRSLIIYDEIGRGTSTFDGMSIAKAVAEYTAGKKIGAKTMFATHYHELTALEDEIDGVVNYNVAAKKRGDDITFLRKIVRGGADESYGIEVAKLAGIPNEVIKRAKEVLSSIDKQVGIHGASQKEKSGNDNVTILDCMNEVVCQQLKDTNIDTLTPIEALNLVYSLKKMLL